MPAAIPIVIAAAATYGAGTAITALAAGTILATAATATAAASLTLLGTIVAGVVGSVVAAGSSMLLGGVLGTDKKPAASSAFSGDFGGAGELAVEARDRKQSVRAPVAPRQRIYGRVRVGGTLVYAASSGADSRYLHLVSVLADHPVAGTPWVFINDEQIPFDAIDANGFVTSGRLAGKARIRVYLGTQTDADPDLIAESPDGWSSDHRLLGCAYLYVRLEYAQDVFAGGLQGIGAIVDGKTDIWDPRSDRLGFTNNWALCVLDYLLSPQGVGCTLDEIDLPYFIAAANLSDEAVAIDAAGTTQQRFAVNGAFSVDGTRRDILRRLMTCGAGFLTYVQGRYRLHGGAYDAPTDTLGISDLAGDVRMTTKPALRDVFNAVKGTFIDTTKGWQAGEFPAVTSAEMEAEDGERIWRDLELPFTTDIFQAQRLARIELLRGREALTIEAPVQYRGIRYTVWQMLSVTIPDLGLTAAPMRVLSWRLDPAAGTVVLRLREESAAAYAWSWSDASVPAPVRATTLISPYAIPAPAGLAADEDLYATRDGVGLRSRLIASWAPAAHPFVSGYDVQLLDAAGAVLRHAGTLGDTRLAIDDLADGAYQIRVRARTALAAGEWATIQAEVGGLAAVPPADVTGLGLQSIGGMAWLRWNAHPDLDVRVGGTIEIRHTPDTGAITWPGATAIGDPLPGGTTMVPVPLMPGAYLVRARDAGGRQSAGFASVTTDAATALSWAALSTLTEHTTFTGARTNTVVLSGTLRLGGGGTVGAVTLFSGIPLLSALGGVAAAGSYQFAAGADLGSVKSVRLGARLVATVVNATATIARRTDPLSTWRLFSGVAGGEATAWVEVRDTPDNPGGTPTWSAWRRLDRSEARARGFQFRAQLRSDDPAFNIHVAQLQATIDEVV
jgi:hypothetical protein